MIWKWKSIKYLLILEEEKKNTTFLFVFSTYLPMFLLKFLSGELVGCGIKFRIQRVPIRHTFEGPHCPKNKKCRSACLSLSSLQRPSVRIVYVISFGEYPLSNIS